MHPAIVPQLGLLLVPWKVDVVNALRIADINCEKTLCDRLKSSSSVDFGNFCEACSRFPKIWTGGRLPQQGLRIPAGYLLAARRRASSVRVCLDDTTGLLIASGNPARSSEPIRLLRVYLLARRFVCQRLAR